MSGPNTHRPRGKRALAGTSANLSGQPTITDAEEVIAVFGRRVSTILLEDVEELPWGDAARRRSSTSPSPSRT
jgi:hypothetical protein